MTLSSRLTVPLCFVYIEMALLWILVGNHEEEKEEEENPLFSRVRERENVEEEEEKPLFSRVGERERERYDVEA
jgi:hypothetical protein